MRLVYTEAASADLDQILIDLATDYPAAYEGFVHRLRMVEEQITMWPRSGAIADRADDLRVVPMVRYPFKLFYMIARDRIEVVHLYHAARDY